MQFVVRSSAFRRFRGRTAHHHPTSQLQDHPIDRRWTQRLPPPNLCFCT